MTPPSPIDINRPERLYFMGIGGIGMSALAQFFLEKGFSIGGYDRTPSGRTDMLATLGIPIDFEENAFRPADWQRVIYTPAVGETFSPLQAARNAHMPVQKRAEVLGDLSRSYRCIAVAGTHGKTSTSGLIAHLLKAAGQDSVAFIGGILSNYNSNYLAGKGQWMVVEADEYDRSFRWLQPEIAVLTSTEPDHLDIYGTPEALRESFGAFAGQIKPGGLLLQHEAAQPLLAKRIDCRVRTYGLDVGEISARNINISGATTRFDYTTPSEEIEGLAMTFPGRHNLQNALAAVAVTKELGLDNEQIKQGLTTFEGIYRRFQVHINTPRLLFIDDYAHHPTELAAAIEAARSLAPENRLVVCFQPHLYSRTRDFATGFAQALNAADAVYLMHIYPARELSIPHVTANLVFQQVRTPYKQLINLNQFVAELPRAVRFPCTVLTLGAGDIETIVPAVNQQLNQLLDRN